MSDDPNASKRSVGLHTDNQIYFSCIPIGCHRGQNDGADFTVISGAVDQGAIGQWTEQLLIESRINIHCVVKQVIVVTAGRKNFIQCTRFRSLNIVRNPISSQCLSNSNCARCNDGKNRQPHSILADG